MKSTFHFACHTSQHASLGLAIGSLLALARRIRTTSTTCPSSIQCIILCHIDGHVFLLLALLVLNLWQTQSAQCLECIVHIEQRLGTRFKKWNIIPLGQFLALICADHASLLEINLVTHEHELDWVFRFWVCVVSYPLNPGLHCIKCLWFCNVVHEHDAMHCTESICSDWDISLLSCCIPNPAFTLDIPPFVFVKEFNLFEFKIYSNCGDE
mmetsp:Transcript_2495/g.9405  ORF Transcript_2495/g.9405 Transcript_2495/m.9405 type:complete len:211 (+) Transcript_2495:553-1185(+)